MTEAVAKIRKQIEALSDDERDELIDSLLELDERKYQLGGPEGKWLTEEELTAELERRTAELECGQVKGIPYEVVMEEFRKKYP